MLTFYEKLSENLTKLLESEYNYDTIIEVGEQPDAQLFKIHSAILYPCSSYFQQKLTNTIKDNNVFNIKLHNISVKAFNIVIKYIYGGIISLENLETSDILDLLIAFNEFNISESVDCLQTRLIEDNASWLRLNFFRIYQISFQSENFKALQQFCNDIIIKNPNLIFDTDDFITIKENALISLLKHDELQLDESMIWDKVILWGKAQTPNLPSNYEQWNDENFKSLKATLQNCLPHVRYFQIPGDEVLEKIQPYKKILEKNLWNDIIAKFVSPNKPITSTILPPRKKLTTQLPSRNSISNDKEIASNNYLEIFSGPIYFPTNKKTIQHDELPSVTNELSVTLQLNLKWHDSNWINIFHKGEVGQQDRTPALLLSQNDSKPHPYCSVKSNWSHYISAGNNLELNKWYHIAYTLSEPQKRMEFYVNGELVGYTNVKDIIFNEFPLKIGHSDKYPDFQGQMSNFRYYNIRLSADEIFKDYISYHSNELGRNQGKILIKEIDPKSKLS
ncbi:concanavalin A-like lectin/glucanase domain-containing protein [Gigaspora rosea]|uniref:Concanavalin A-like lectin/glucanase domain-containing protein n=1 Tax=Gigaspora rosea TaxID=44941 RepID=A0A397TZQ5_9GLOM|nr:concanavalin A-like lectin/glucanase domain-containing protein [Gigaspora rosea]